MKSFGSALLIAVMIVSGGGCKKSAPEGGPSLSAATNQPALTLARVHWLGKTQIAAGTNAARFMSLWDLPQSATLEAQTLDKLALAMTGAGQAAAASTRLLATNPAAMVTNYQALVAGHPAAARLRPLLHDLLQEEWYLEIYQNTNPPVEIALAVRLAEPRATLWSSNLPALLGSLTNVQSLPAATNRVAWRLPTASPPSTLSTRPSRLELVRAGDWTLLGLAGDRNTRLEEFAKRIQRDRTPVPPSVTAAALEMDPVTRKLHPATNGPAPAYWLEADLNLPRLSGALALGWNLPCSLSNLFLTVIGDEQGVRTRARLDFPGPVPLEMEPWNIPTNLIHDPLIGFAAVRGIRPWLESCKLWNKLQLGAPPNQAFFWAQGGAPSLHFLAAPSAQASNQVNTLSEWALRDLNPILATNGWPLSAFGRKTNSPGLLWRGAPYFLPDLDCVDSDGHQFLLAGLAPNRMTNLPAPAGLFDYLRASPNLVAYDWENTQPCLDSWTQMGQLTRHMLVRPRMTLTAGFVWAAALSPSLTNSITMVELTGPTQLSLVRVSTAGFTGAELHLLADWLESLDFPRGLHTLTAPVPPVPVWPTNAPAGNQLTNAAR